MPVHGLQHATTQLQMQRGRKDSTGRLGRSSVTVMIVLHRTKRRLNQSANAEIPAGLSLEDANILCGETVVCTA